MDKTELERFEKEFDDFYDKCEIFVEKFGWDGVSEWTRFESPFFSLKGLIDFSKDLKECPKCKKFSSAEDWANPVQCDYC